MVRRRADGILRYRRVCTSQTFLLGACTGIALSWLFNQLLLVFGWRGPSAMHILPVPFDPPPAGNYHAIIIPAGGQTDSGPPEHVQARLERAAHLYETSPEPKPYVITTAWGTPHKPCPHDTAGFERHEAQDNAQFLLARGVDASRILEESVRRAFARCAAFASPADYGSMFDLHVQVSLETVGNAYFTRVLHTDVRALRRLAIVNNHFHMARTKAVFEHVFRVPQREGELDTTYELDFVEVEDRLPEDVRDARSRKEAASIPKFAVGGPWQEVTPTLRELHDWVSGCAARIDLQSCLHLVSPTSGHLSRKPETIGWDLTFTHLTVVCVSCDVCGHRYTKRTQRMHPDGCS